MKFGVWPSAFRLLAICDASSRYGGNIPNGALDTYSRGHYSTPAGGGMPSVRRAAGPGNSRLVCRIEFWP